MDVVNVSNAWMQFLTKLSGVATAMVYMTLVISLGTSAMDGKLALVYGYILAEVSILKEHLSTDIGGRNCTYVLKWISHLPTLKLDMGNKIYILKTSKRKKRRRLPMAQLRASSPR